MYVKINAAEFVKYSFCLESSVRHVGHLCGNLSWLIDWRIIMAPEHLMAFKEDPAQRELLSHPTESGETTKEIRLVRYTARCHICHAKVLLID